MGSFSAHATTASRSPPLVVVSQEYIQLPGREAAANPFEAVGFVGVGVNAQIFMAIAAIELASIDVPYGDGEPGDYGFDPLKFLEGKSEYEVDRMKVTTTTKTTTTTTKTATTTSTTTKPAYTSTNTTDSPSSSSTA